MGEKSRYDALNEDCAVKVQQKTKRPKILAAEWQNNEKPFRVRLAGQAMTTANRSA
jgi:hypothetical protein